MVSGGRTDHFSRIPCASFIRRAAVLVFSVIASGACGGGEGITVTNTVTGLRFVTQPSNVTMGQSFSVAVELVGSNGQRATTATNTVTLSLVGAALGGTTSAAAVAGVATFSGLTVATAAANLSLTASSAGFSATSNAFASVDPLAPTGLRFVTQPANVSLGTPFSVSVEFITSSNQRATTTTNAVALSATGGTISGTTTASAVAGLATFSGLTFSTAASNLVLTASSGSFNVTSSSFAAIDACAPVALTFPGTVNGTLTAGGCTNAGRPAAFYRFTGTGSGGTSFTVTSAFPSELAVTNDPPGEFLFFTGASPVSGTWLLPAGTFQLRLASTSGTGAYTVTGTNTIGTGCIAVALLPFASVTYSSALASTDCVLAADGSYYERYYIYSTKACTITMRSTVFNSYLFVKNQRTQITIAQDDNTGGGSDARISLAACNSGGDLIEIWANTFTTATAGAYTLAVTVTGGSSLMSSAPASAPDNQSNRGVRVHSGPAERDSSAATRKSGATVMKSQR
jgi:hypothetical protein